MYICKLKHLVMQFKDIVGQRDTINQLTEIIDSGRVSHAQMVLGETRQGALQLALAYMQYLVCEHRQQPAEEGLRADSCGECPSCRKMSQLVHPDLHLFFPNATTTRVKDHPSSAEFGAEFRQFIIEGKARLGLEEWYEYCGMENKQGIIREEDAAAMVQSLSMKSYEGGWKMVLVWMPEKMNSRAANELLKTLEEPSEKTLIMLVCEHEEQLLTTIRSRVQLISLEQAAADDSAERRQAEAFAPMVVSWLRLLFKLKMKPLSDQVDEMAKLTREQQKQLLGYALDLMRRCFLHTAAGLPVSLGSGDDRFDQMFPQMVTVNNIALIEEAIDQALFAIERNAYGRLALMQLSFNMSKALKKR